MLWSAPPKDAPLVLTAVFEDKDAARATPVVPKPGSLGQ